MLLVVLPDCSRVNAAIRKPSTGNSRRKCSMCAEQYVPRLVTYRIEYRLYSWVSG